MNIFHTDISVLTGNLFKLERSGRYEEALAELRPIWEDFNAFPDVDEFAPFAAAEIILRCGALIGFYGHSKIIPNSQEISKNLLTDARCRFFDFGDIEKIAECENYLALAYHRTGELGEAETFVSEALLHKLPNSSQIRLHSYLIRNVILGQLKRIDENLRHLQEVESDFLKYGTDLFKGDFYSHYGLNLRKNGNVAQALEKYKLAKHFFQKARHLTFLAIVENNLTYIYKSEGKLAEAHQAIDKVVKIFKELKDRTREGFALDTKAQIFCDEHKYPEALKVIEKAIGILIKSENADFLVETYLTKAKILLNLENFTAAFLCLSDAVQLARTKMSEEKAENLVKEFEALMKEKTPPVISKTFAEKEIGEKETGRAETLELVLHPTIAHYQEFQGIWIKNSHLENFGLQKNSLAVVTKADIKRGDLVAINEIATNSVMCGFYDSEFGIVCLEGIDEEPRLFDENDIEILGKIVGVGRSDKNSKGKIQVNPLNL
jgi:tetratricopeptide (TPR) repeat protein